jgi:hypothetical protein
VTRRPKRFLLGTLTAIGAIVLVLAVALAVQLFGTAPKFGMEAYFQQVIAEAQLRDGYSSTTGWDKADVSGRICDRVSVVSLNSLGLEMSEQVAGRPKPANVWRVQENKSLWDVCRDHFHRVLDIAIDKETMVCTATVRDLPECDP